MRAVVFGYIICAGCALAADRVSAPTLDELTVLRETNWDFGPPMWEKDLLIAKAVGDGFSLRWFHFLPVDMMCAKGAFVRVTEKQVMGVSLAAVISGRNPCAVRQKDLLPKRRRHELIFSSVGNSIAATCGGETHILHLPRFQMFDSVRLAKRVPDAAGLWDLFDKLSATAVAAGNPFPEAKLFGMQDSTGTDRAPAEEMIAQLTSGRYDSLLESDCGKKSNCSAPTFRGLLGVYRTGMIGPSANVVLLMRAISTFWSSRSRYIRL